MLLHESSSLFFLLQTYDDMCQVSNIFKLKSIRFTINNISSHYLIIIPLTFLLKNPEKLRMIAAATEFSGVPRNRSSGIFDA